MAGSCIPLLDLKTQDVAPLNDSSHTEVANDAHKFRFTQSNLILFCKTFFRCLVIIVLIASLLATLKIYQNKELPIIPEIKFQYHHHSLKSMFGTQFFSKS